MMTWDEVGDRCYRRRYRRFESATPASLELNIGVILGSSGALLIDTGPSVAEARSLLDDLRTLGVSEPRWVVNTHAHFDHCFGNVVFRTAALYGHPACAEAMRGPSVYEESRSHGVEDVEVVPPEVLVSSSREIDLGDRSVGLRWLGAGHTAGDLVVAADDVVFAGDLVEESGPPVFGPDSYPLSWPSAVSALLDLPVSAYVPGHGDVVDRAFVSGQAGDLEAVAAGIRSAHVSGLAEAEALRSCEWPFPSEHLAQAVRRGYEHLDRRG